MREIIFRGKATLTAGEMKYHEIPHNNGWVYGNLIEGYIVSDIIEATEEYLAPSWWVRVDHTTIGQYTGLKDKTGRHIFEGDILSFKEILWNDCSKTEMVKVREEALIGITTYNELCSVIKVYSGQVFSFAHNSETNECITTGIDPDELEIIGNVYDNKDIIKCAGHFPD